MRENVLALVCLRHGLPTYEGRGFDDLPPNVIESLTETLPRSLDVAELKRAFRITGDALVEKVAQADINLLARLVHPSVGYRLLRHARPEL